MYHYSWHSECLIRLLVSAFLSDNGTCKNSYYSLSPFSLPLSPSLFLKVNILNNNWRECWESYKRGYGWLFFFSRLVNTYFFDQEVVVYANCAVHYFCQCEQWYWQFIYVLLSNVCFPGMWCSVFCRQFYRSCFLFYIDVIMLVQIFRFC